MARLRRPLVLLVAAAAAVAPYAGTPVGAQAAPLDDPGSGTTATEVALGSESQGPTKTVAYDGVSVQVPADWPVVDLTRDPTACVRFDVEAVYLGEAGEQQDCPAHAVGRADTVWLRDADAADGQPMAAARHTTVGGLTARVEGDALAQRKRVELPAQDVAIQATWSQPSTSVRTLSAGAPTGKTVVDQVLDSARPTSAPDTSAAPNPDFHATAPKIRVPGKGAASGGPGEGNGPGGPGVLGPGAVSATNASAPLLTSAAGTSGANVARGMGFDACAAPSTNTMQAWLKSPYRSVGIYIGGSMRACGDGNLSAGWVDRVTDMGWGLIPIWVGPQAPCVHQGGLAHISRDRAAAQGRANADAAVDRARYFGLGRGAPIYYDMEMYDTNNSRCTDTVMTFLSAWSAELKAQGYRPGAYGGNSSLMKDLSNYVGSPGFTPPKDIWSADWNGLQTTDTRWVPDRYWKNHQRLHQYASGSETWGGVRINIDANYMDGHVAGPARTVDYGSRSAGPGHGAFRFTGNMTYWRPNAGSGLRDMAYWTHPSSDGNEYNGATWSPWVPRGLYRVKVYVPGSYANAKAKYTITHDGGRTTRTIDQSRVGGWVSLGKYFDRRGSRLRVHVADNGSTATKTYLGVDAVRFNQIATAPGRPRSVSATAGDASAKVRWEAADPNGRAVDKYRVTASPGGKTVTVDGSRRSVTISGLDNGTDYTFRVRAHNVVGWGSWSGRTRSVAPSTLGALTTVRPVRILDTRRGTTANSRDTAIPAHGRITVRVAGVKGSPVPARADAVALNIAVVHVHRGGRLYVGNDRDGRTTMKFRRNRPRDHLLVSPLRDNGTVTVVNHSGGRVDVLLDVHGYVVPGSAGNYHAVSPTRILDTRRGARANARDHSLWAHQRMTVRIGDVTGSPVPASAEGVALNITVTGPRARGYLQLSNGRTRSILHFRRGDTTAHFQVARLRSDGTISLTNHSDRRVDVIVDVQGYVTRSGGRAVQARDAFRAMDTRFGTDVNPRDTALRAGQDVRVHLAGFRGSPVPGNAKAVVLNVQVLHSREGGRLYVGRRHSGRAVLNFRRGQNVTNHVVSEVTRYGNVTVRNYSGGRADVIVDVVGWIR